VCRSVVQSPQTKLEGEEFCGHQPECAADPDLDSADRHAAVEMDAPSLQGEVVLPQSASMLRLNLFTYRDLRRWLENPFGTPPLVPLAEQLSLDLSLLGQAIDDISGQG